MSRQSCHACKKRFEEAERKHHCRSCGEGFCHPCSSYRMPVPERGWGSGPVRVCQTCHQQGGPTEAEHQGETLCTLITAANFNSISIQFHLISFEEDIVQQPISERGRFTLGVLLPVVWHSKTQILLQYSIKAIHSHRN